MPPKAKPVPVQPRYNEHQMQFIQQPVDANLKLYGIPGGGKTAAVLGRVCHLIDTKQLTDNTAFIILTFSKQAQQDLVHKGAQVRKKLFDKKNVRTVHSVAGIICRSFGVEQSSLETVVLRAAKALVEQNADTIKSKVPLLTNLRTIIVDEAQDLNECQYDLVRTLSTCLGASFVMVGDPNQAIYGFQGGNSKFLLDHAGFTVALVYNYRSTRSLVSLIDAARPHRVEPMISATDNASEDVKATLFTGSDAEIAAHLVHTVQEMKANNPKKTIAILGPTKSAKPGHEGYLNLGLQWASHVLRDQGFGVQLHYIETGKDAGVSTGKRKREAHHSTDSIHVLTIHGSKGLEFDCVLLLNFHHATMGRIPSTKSEESELSRLWFVGLSRARTNMVIYQLTGRPIWPGVKPLVEHLIANTPIQVEPVIARRSQKLGIAWKELIQSRDILSERHLGTLEDLTGVSMQEHPPLLACPDNCQTADLPDFDSLSLVYGMWAESTFYNALTTSLPPVYRSVFVKVNNSLCVNQSSVWSLKALFNALRLRNTDPIPLEQFDTFRLSVADGKYATLFAAVDQWREVHPSETHVFVHVPNLVQFFNPDVVRVELQHMKECDSRRDLLTPGQIWYLCLFEWQLSCEARWRWDLDYSMHLTALQPISTYITNLARTLVPETNGTANLEVTCEWVTLPIEGRADLVYTSADGTQHIIELKFSQLDLALTHMLQVWGYAAMLQKSDECRQVIEVWNLKSGQRWVASGPSGDTVCEVETFLTPVLHDAGITRVKESPVVDTPRTKVDKEELCFF